MTTSLYRFSESMTMVNCNCEVSGSYVLQLASAALSIPTSPSTKSQVQEARSRPWGVGAVMVAAAPRAGPQQPGHLHSYRRITVLLHSGTKLSVVIHRAADRSGSNKIQKYWKLIGYRIRQWWLNFGRSSLGLQYNPYLYVGSSVDHELVGQ